MLGEMRGEWKILKVGPYRPVPLAPILKPAAETCPLPSGHSPLETPWGRVLHSSPQFQKIIPLLSVPRVPRASLTLSFFSQKVFQGLELILPDTVRLDALRRQQEGSWHLTLCRHQDGPLGAARRRLCPRPLPHQGVLNPSSRLTTKD